ncbi:MAG: hypothetical protein U0359_27860 [Byssovorax sp.]
MSISRTAGRMLGAGLLGLGFVAACAGAAPEASAVPASPEPSASPATSTHIEPLSPAGDATALGKSADSHADAGPPGDAGSAPRCPYGELNDPHRGFVRCLLPDERDAGWLPPPSQEPPHDDAGAAPNAPDAAAPDAGKEPPAAPPQVEIGAPVFENGSVPKVEKMLNAASADIGKCVAEHGGLTGSAGTLKVQFLVRSRGRAEGVEVLTRKGLSPEAASCVRLLFKNKAVGAPTADPVGVTVTLTLKPASR